MMCNDETETKKTTYSNGAGEHDFGGIFLVNNAGFSHHSREYEKCDLRQVYGRLYGSKKHPGYQSVNSKCPRKE